MEGVLDFNFEEEDILLETATKRIEEETAKQRTKEKALRLHSEVVVNYCFRMSAINKIKFLSKLLANVHSLEQIQYILQFMSIGHAKTDFYAATDPNTSFIFEKAIADHDRMLDKKILKKTIDADLQWFHTLDDLEQIRLIINLLRQTGGHVRRKIIIPLLVNYHNAIKNLNIRPPRSVVEDENCYIRPLEDDKYDPSHPATIEVEKERKKWNQMIAKYRIKVEGKPEKKEKEGKKEKKGGKDKKSKEKSKIDKSSKDKKSKKGKDKGSKEVEMDWIQLLPIWISKKIFSYFDTKTLKKLKKVNSYWAFVIQEIMKEAKMRKKIDSTLKKLKAQLGPVTVEESSLPIKPVVHKIRKRKINYERGAIIKELIPKKSKTTVEKSLFSDAANEMEAKYFTDKVVSFPRIINDNMVLYRHQPCFLRDRNITIGVHEDATKPGSFLTYTQSEEGDSFTITVETQVMEGW